MTEKITSSEIRVLSSAFYSDSYSETPCISATYSRAFHPWRRTWEFLLPTTRQPTRPQTNRWSMRIWHDATNDKWMSMTSWMISSKLKWPFLQQFANQKRNCAALPLFWKEYWLTQIFLQSSFNRPTPPPSTIILLIFSRWKADMILDPMFHDCLSLSDLCLFSIQSLFKTYQSRVHLNQLRTSKDSRKPETLGTFR